MLDLVMDPAVLAAATRELDTLRQPGELGGAQVAAGAVGSAPGAAEARAAINDALQAAGAVSQWLDRGIREHADAIADLSTAARQADQLSQTRGHHLARPVATDARRSP